MLELKILREKPEFVIERLAVKNFDAREIVGKILDIDSQRRSIQTGPAEQGRQEHWYAYEGRKERRGRGCQKRGG